MTSFSFATDQETESETHLSIKIIHSEGQKFYTTSVKLRTGEVAYFACEPIFNQDRSDWWSKYRNFTASLVSSDMGNLSFACAKKLRNTALSLLFGETQKYKGEVEDLILNLNDSEKMRQSLCGIASGCIGMSKEIGSYISYISKKPIEGFCNLPAPDIKLNFDQYIENYQHIVMSVSSYGDPKESDGESYNHRGIFRNPISMLRGDYPGISMILHGFTGLVWSIKSPNIKRMGIAPDLNGVMRKMILHHCGENAKQHGLGVTVPVSSLVELFENLQLK